MEKVILSPVYPSSVICWAMQAKAVDRKFTMWVKSKDEKGILIVTGKPYIMRQIPEPQGSHSVWKPFHVSFIIGMIHCLLKYRSEIV